MVNGMHTGTAVRSANCIVAIRSICKSKRSYIVIKLETNPLNTSYSWKEVSQPLIWTVASEHRLMVSLVNGYQDEVPLLDREPGLELDVPMSERAMVMVKVEGWIPVDVKPIIVDSIETPNRCSLSIALGG